MEAHGTLEQYRSILHEPVQSSAARETRHNHSNPTQHDVQDNGSKPTNWHPQLKEIIEFEDEDGDTQEVDIGKYNLSQWLDSSESRESRSPFKNFAMVLRHSYEHHEKSTRLEIQSESLREIFQSIGTPYRDIEFTDNPIVIPRPFQILFFEREKLQSLSTSEEQPERTKQELKELLSFIHSDRGLQQTISAYDDLVLKENKITHGLLWTLYPPLTVVHTHEVTNVGFAKETCAMVSGTEVHYTERHSNRRSPAKPNRISTANTVTTIDLGILYGSHDGTRFRICEKDFTLDYRSGKFDINRENCKFFPLWLLPAEDQRVIRERLVRRGKKYIDICNIDFRFLQYDGPMTLLTEESKFSRGFGLKDGLSERDRTSQRVVIDKDAE